MEHLVAISPVEELKPRATAEGPASAEVGRTRWRWWPGRPAAVEVVEEAAAVDVAAAVDDDVSWRFGRPGVLRNRKLLKRNRERNRD